MGQPASCPEGRQSCADGKWNTADNKRIIMINAYMNWSGGKDSALCLHKAMESGQYNITQLLTSVNSVHDRISMHGVRRSLLEAQARAMGIPLKTIELPEQPGMEEYES